MGILLVVLCRLVAHDPIAVAVYQAHATALKCLCGLAAGVQRDVRIREAVIRAHAVVVPFAAGLAVFEPGPPGVAGIPSMPAVCL